VYCDFTVSFDEFVLIQEDQQTKTNDTTPSESQSSVTSVRDTVEDILDIWMRYVASPYEGIGFELVLQAHQQLVEASRLLESFPSSVTVSNLRKIHLSPHPYFSSHLALPEGKYEITRGIFLLQKVLSSRGNFRWLLETMPGELDTMQIPCADTKNDIMQRINSALNNKNLFVANETLQKLWFNDSFKNLNFSVKVIKTLTRMDSQDLINFVKSFDCLNPSSSVAPLSSEFIYETYLKPMVNNDKLQLDERINWVILFYIILYSINYILQF
jgi:hypothetical protein